MEEHWSKRDCDTMLATRQTYKQRQEQEQKTGVPNGRILKFMASVKRRSDIPQGRKVYQFDKDGLLQEVNAMQDGDRVSIIFHSIYVLNGDQASRIINE